MANTGYTPAPGPQRPEKYPFVGSNYKRYGEVAGYLYHPWSDRYYPDPKAERDLADSQGVGPGKEPGLGDTLGPIAGTFGAMELGKEAGKGVGSWIGSGGGSGAAETGTAAATPTTAGTVGETAAGSSSGGGLIGAGGTSGGSGGAGGGASSAGASGGSAGGGSSLGLPGVAAATANNPIGMAGGAVALGSYINNIWEGGGKDIIKGKGRSEDYINLPLDVNPVTAPINMGLRVLGLPSVGRALNPESTKQAQARRWGGLIDQGVKGAAGLQAASHPEDDDGVWDDTGEAWNFETAAERAKKNPDEFRGVYGNLSVVGQDWFGMTPEQQRAFITKNLDAGNYASEKGDVIIKDHALANQFKDEILGKKPKEDTTQKPKGLIGAGR